MQPKSFTLSRLSSIRSGSLAASTFVAALALTHAAQASDWNNTGTGLWNNTANWSAGLPGDAFIFNGGTAQITTGDTFAAGQIIAGENAIGNVSQDGGSLTTNNWVVIGKNTGTGTFNLSGGTWGHSGQILQIAENSPSHGFINVSGTGSLTSSTNIVVGSNGGNGTLTIAGSGTVTSNGEFQVGNNNSASVGTVTMTGGTLNVNNWVGIGRAGGTGTLNLSGGTINKNGNGDFLVGDGATGTMTQTGGTLIANNWTSIGKGGTGTYNLSGGTLTQNGWLVIGRDGGTGTFNHSGGTYTNNDRFIIGLNGSSGVATVSAGAVVNSGGEVWVGQDGGSNGTLNVTGGTVNVSNWFTTGRNGSTGTINVSGGTVNKTGGGNISIASGGGGAGTGYLNISGGTVNSNGTVYISETGGTAAFTMSGTGLANFPVLQIGGAGTTSLDGGTLAVTQFTGTGTVNFNGGTLKANTGAQAAFLGGLGTVRVRNGAAIIDTNGQSVTISQAIQHSALGGDNATDGGLTKIGAGTLTLTGANSYNGATTVSVGTLALGASDVIGDASAVDVSGGTLDLGTNSDTVGALTYSAGSLIGSGVLSPASTTVSNTSGSLTVGVALAGAGSFAKTGAGSVVLPSTNTYTGSTTVSAGTLSLGSSGSLPAGTILSVSNATLDLRNGVGSRAQTVDTLTLTGATLQLGLGGSTTDSLNVADVAAISGSNTIKLTGSASTGTYNLISTPAALTGTFVLDTSALVTGFTTYSADISGNNYVLTVDANDTPATAYWQGGYSTIWGDANFAPLSNWATDAAGTTDANQVPGVISDVIFSSTGAGNTSTTLGTDFSVKSLTFASGSASVTGANSLTLAGVNGSGHSLEVLSGASATLGYASSSYSGSTAVQAGGTLNAGASTLGSATGTLLVNGTLNVNGANTKADLSGTGTVAGSSVLTLDTAGTTFPGSFGGSVGLTKAGAGALTLTGSSSHSGTTTVSAGTLNIGNGGTTGSLGSSPVVVSSGTVLNLNRSNDFAVTGDLSGGGNLVQIGTGTSTYSGADTRSGSTTVSSGILSYTGTANGPSYVVAGGTFHNLSGTITSATDFNAGNGAGINGDVQIDGGSYTQTAGIFYVGRNGGSGSYTQAGGTVTVPGGYRLGTGTAGSTATATLSNGSLSTTGEFWISDATNNSASMTMSGGTLTTGNWFVIGRQVGGVGSMTLSGGTVSKGGGGNSIIGSLGGTGSLTQTGGAFNTTAGAILLGENAGTTPALNTLWNMSGGTSSVAADVNVAWHSSEATWNVSGSSVVTSAGRLAVACENSDTGANGTGLNGSVVNGAPVGTVNISGGSVSFTGGGDSRIGGDVGNASAAIGTVSVSGGSLSIAGNFQVGGYGNGTLNVSNAGSVTSSGWFTAGRFGGSTGTINVNGGTLTQSDAGKLLMIGEQGTGTLNVSGTGLVDANEVRLGHDTNGNGTLNLNGGTLFTKVVQRTNTATGVATVKLNGGVIKSKADAASLFLDIPDASISVDQGGAKFDTNGFNATIVQALAPVAATTGGLTKSGAGTLTLNGLSTFTGPVTVNGGTLKAGSDDAFGADGALAVNATGTLDVNGKALGHAVTVVAGGTLTGAGEIGSVTSAGSLQPGNGVGNLDVLGDLTLSAASQATFELGGAASADHVNAYGATVLDGTVTVSLVNGFTPSAGQTFTLISSPGAGLTFAGFDVNADLSLPVLGGSLLWTRSLSATALTISVISTDPVVSYAAGFGLTGPDTAAGADPDHDGISNALEYAFGISPTASNSAQYRGVGETTSGKLSLAYRRPVGGGVSGVTYGVQVKTSDLNSGDTGWTDAVEGALNDYTKTVVSNLDGTTETVTITFNGAVTSGKKFGRVSVTY